MEDTESHVCKHSVEAPDSCPPTCECWCDDCQQRYETSWDQKVATEQLCVACGIPKGELSLGRLSLFQYIHFYLPCLDCSPRLNAFMKKEGLCPGCRSPTSSDQPCERCLAAAAANPAPAASSSAGPADYSENHSEMENIPSRMSQSSAVRPGTPRPSSPALLSWVESEEKRIVHG